MRPYKYLRKEEKLKAKEKRKDIPICMQSSKEWQGDGELVADVVLETAENTVKRGLLTGLEEASLRKILCGEEAAGYRVAAIDPGVDNFCAVTNNFGAAPFLIKGGAIKSENRYYNKKMAVLRSEAMRCNGRWETRRTGRLTDRRNRILKDLLHKASRRIADWAEENRADLVILGHNVFQKQRVSMGRANNQTFVQIPYSVFAGMLRYKLEEKGIAFLETEESYTSKADYLAGDRIPTYGKNLKDNPPVFSGKRIKRGLYLHYDGTRSNADLQGIFPNQGSDLGLPQCRQILYHLSHQGSSRILEWVAYPFSRGSS